MLQILLVSIANYLIASLFGYLTHRALHQEWTGRLNDAHMTHHFRLYPPSDFLSEKYRSAGKDSTPKFFLAAAMPVVIGIILLTVYGVLSIKMMGFCFMELFIIGWLHNYLHDAFHIRDHLLFRLPMVKILFKKWVRLHYLHHIDMQTNFGIFIFHWDHVFKTYWKDELPKDFTDRL